MTTPPILIIRELIFRGAVWFLLPHGGWPLASSREMQVEALETLMAAVVVRFKCYFMRSFAG